FRYYSSVIFSENTFAALSERTSTSAFTISYVFISANKALFTLGTLRKLRYTLSLYSGNTNKVFLLAKSRLFKMPVKSFVLGLSNLISSKTTMPLFLALNESEDILAKSFTLR